MDIKLMNGVYVVGEYSIAGNYDDGYTVQCTEDGQDSDTLYDDISLEKCLCWVLKSQESDLYVQSNKNNDRVRK